LNLEKSQEFSLAVARELRRLRQEKGISQAVLAEKAGLSRAAIQHIEKGIRNPTLMVTHAIACALGTSLSDVIAKVD
jgi:transcriptional regulator with XRE-family HTH domain